MSSEGERKGKKRTKAFYRKSAYGAKRHRSGANVLEPGIRGFLVMCNSNESSAVRESYNILNEYADRLFGQEQTKDRAQTASAKSTKEEESEEDSDCDDIEKALRKEVDGIKSTSSEQRRFQNVATKAKNCVFIRTTVEDPVKLILSVMEDISEHGLKKARFAARILPIVGTCKAHTPDVEELAKKILGPIFSASNPDCPLSYTVLFKARNNNGSTCGKTSVIPAVTKVMSEINPAVKFTWSEYKVAILVEVVCTVCCLGVAPDYARLRKYNLQELQQGPRIAGVKAEEAETQKSKDNEVTYCGDMKEAGSDNEVTHSDVAVCKDKENDNAATNECQEKKVDMENQQEELDCKGVSESVETVAVAEPVIVVQEDHVSKSENIKEEQAVNNDPGS